MQRPRFPQRVECRLIPFLLNMERLIPWDSIPFRLDTRAKEIVTITAKAIIRSVSFFCTHMSLQRIKLNKYPRRMMDNVTDPKNHAMSLGFITFRSNVASGKESPTTAIEKASAVPSGIPLLTKA